jgi:5'-AMP-activated protein kinase catalytic alpha subunit
VKEQGVFEKVKREIKILRQFNHPHIIKHFEFIDTPSDIFMVLEFASGGELFDLISRRERVSVHSFIFLHTSSLSLFIFFII